VAADRLKQRGRPWVWHLSISGTVESA